VIAYSWYIALTSKNLGIQVHIPLINSSDASAVCHRKFSYCTLWGFNQEHRNVSLEIVFETLKVAVGNLQVGATAPSNAFEISSGMNMQPEIVLHWDTQIYWQKLSLTTCKYLRNNETYHHRRNMLEIGFDAFLRHSEDTLTNLSSDCRLYTGRS